MTGGETNRGIRMEHTQLRKPSSAQRKHTSPRQMALLAPSAKGTPPESQQPVPKHGKAL